MIPADIVKATVDDIVRDAPDHVAEGYYYIPADEGNRYCTGDLARPCCLVGHVLSRLLQVEVQRRIADEANGARLNSISLLATHFTEDALDYLDALQNAQDARYTWYEATIVAEGSAPA